MVVVDTNVLVVLLIDSDRTRAAQALFAADDDWRTEPFALIELSNVLATACRTRDLPVADAVRVLETAEHLMRDRLQSVAHHTALQVADEFRISAYDARFVALARQLERRLVTEDARLRRAVPDWTRSIEETLGAA